MRQLIRFNCWHGRCRPGLGFRPRHSRRADIVDGPVCRVALAIIFQGAGSCGQRRWLLGMLVQIEIRFARLGLFFLLRLGCHRCRVVSNCRLRLGLTLPALSAVAVPVATVTATVLRREIALLRCRAHINDRRLAFSVGCDRGVLIATPAAAAALFGIRAAIAALATTMMPV